MIVRASTSDSDSADHPAKVSPNDSAKNGVHREWNRSALKPTGCLAYCTLSIQPQLVLPLHAIRYTP